MEAAARPNAIGAKEQFEPPAFPISSLAMSFSLRHPFLPLSVPIESTLTADRSASPMHGGSWSK